MSTTLEKGILIVVGAVIAFLLIRMFLIILFLLITPEGEIHRKRGRVGPEGAIGKLQLWSSTGLLK